MKVSSSLHEITQGDDFPFRVEIYNMGDAQNRFDITLNYRVMDSNDNMVFNTEETLAVETSLAHDKSIKLPLSTKPGKYTLKVFANYGEKLATGAVSFELKKKETTGSSIASCYDGKKNQDEIAIDCGGVCRGYWYNNICNEGPEGEGNTNINPNTNNNNNNQINNLAPSCDDSKENQDETGVDCGGVCGGYWYSGSCHPVPEKQTNKDMTYNEVMVNAKASASTNPDEAAELCKRIQAQEGRDSCFTMVASESKRYSYCEQVEGYPERDSCYQSFFLAGNFNVCSKLRLADNKKDCEQLRDISLAQKLVDEGNVEGAAAAVQGSEALNE